MHRRCHCWLAIWLATAGLAAAQEPEVSRDPAFAEIERRLDALEKPAAEPTPLPTSEQSLEQRVGELEAALKKSRQGDSANGEVRKPTIGFSMQLQADSLTFNQDEANKVAVGEIENGEAFRRARIAMLGEYSITEYRIEVDFALAGRPSFLDVWASLKDLPLLGRVKAGHYFEPFCLERYTPNRFMTFNERCLIDQAFAPARNLGIMAINDYADLSGTWAIGVFRDSSDNFGDDSGDSGERALTGRLTWLPWYDEPADGRYMLHLGAGASYRDPSANVVQLRAQPEARYGGVVPNVPFFVDTGLIPSEALQLFGAEAAWVHGPLSIQAEAMYVPVDRLDASRVAFNGYYVYGSYFLTGEHRPYRREFGVFDRVIPFEEFFLVRTKQGVCHGCGAWELAARLSYVDLDDADVRGGRLTDVTAGLNWYMNPYLRLTANYIHAFLDSPVNGDSNCDIVSLRVGYEF